MRTPPTVRWVPLAHSLTQMSKMDLTNITLVLTTMNVREKRGDTGYTIITSTCLATDAF